MMTFATFLSRYGEAAAVCADRRERGGKSDFRGAKAGFFEPQGA